jgi:hypothetical protein
MLLTKTHNVPRISFAAMLESNVLYFVPCILPLKRASQQYAKLPPPSPPLLSLSFLNRQACLRERPSRPSCSISTSAS